MGQIWSKSYNLLTSFINMMGAELKQWLWKKLLPRCTLNFTIWSGANHLNIMTKVSHSWVGINVPWCSFRTNIPPTLSMQRPRNPMQQNQSYYSIKILKISPPSILNEILLRLLGLSSYTLPNHWLWDFIMSNKQKRGKQEDNMGMLARAEEIVSWKVPKWEMRKYL